MTTTMQNKSPVTPCYTSKSLSCTLHIAAHHITTQKAQHITTQHNTEKHGATHKHNKTQDRTTHQNTTQQHKKHMSQSPWKTQLQTQKIQHVTTHHNHRNDIKKRTEQQSTKTRHFMCEIIIIKAKQQRQYNISKTNNAKQNHANNNVQYPQNKLKKAQQKIRNPP